MKSYVNCPSCGRYITLEMVEASCQLCGADMCSRCLHTCSDCGKEVCRDCWRGQNMCRQCINSNHILDGLGKTRKWETDGEGLIGIGKAVYGATKYFIDGSNLRDKSTARANEREQARRRIEAMQRKRLE